MVEQCKEINSPTRSRFQYMTMQKHESFNCFVLCSSEFGCFSVKDMLFLVALTLQMFSQDGGGEDAVTKGGMPLATRSVVADPGDTL